jgi:large subunit ribosomal protein L19
MSAEISEQSEPQQSELQQDGIESSEASGTATAAAEAPVAEAAAVSSVATTATPAGSGSGRKVRLSAQALISAFESSQLRDDLPEIFVGDTVRVGVRIREGNKERVQPYEGVVIAKRHGGLNATITVRRIFQGIGVERVFMLHSPQVASVKVERRGKVRRAKLFYLRDRVGKATRVKQRFDR